MLSKGLFGSTWVGLWLLFWDGLFWNGVVESAPMEDFVEFLPDYGKPPTPQYSGYLDATAGCDTVTNGKECKIHYWLAMAQGSSSSDDDDAFDSPVVLWLNGGPGSTSILGFLQELGPLLINATGGLMNNPWSWTQIAHVLVLEAPVGVGYSYCANQKDDGIVCKNTDRFTARASRAALQDFFYSKFPELAFQDFFITGESYAGVYIPTLAKELLDHAPEINLLGIAVGDPCTDNTAQRDSMDSLWYGYKYGLVDEDIYNLLWNVCQIRQPNLMTQGGVHLVAAKLNQHLKQIQFQKQWNTHQLKQYAQRLWKSMSQNPGPDFLSDQDDCQLAWHKYLMSTSLGLSQSWGDLYIDDYSLFAPVTSQEDLDMQAYMSREDVRQALHVHDAPTSTWPYPDVGFDYTKEYDACNENVQPGAWSMIDFYKDIVPRLQRTWIYNGDTDPCVSYEGTRTAVKRFGFAELDGGSYRPWFYNQTGTPIGVLQEKAPLFGPNLVAQNMGAQFGGEVVNYQSGLAFLTVHGSGHMVPQFRPQAALHLLRKFVNFQELTPLLPLNKTLAAMSNGEFQTFMDEWTESATSFPYVTAGNTHNVSTKRSSNDNKEVNMKTA